VDGQKPRSRQPGPRILDLGTRCLIVRLSDAVRVAVCWGLEWLLFGSELRVFYLDVDDAVVVFGVGLQQPALGRPQPINRRDAGDGGEHEVLAGRQKPTNINGGPLGGGIRRVCVKAPQDGLDSAFKATRAVSSPANTPHAGRRGVNGQAWWSSPQTGGIGQRRQVGQWYSVNGGWTHGEGAPAVPGLESFGSVWIAGAGIELHQEHEWRRGP